MRTFKTLSVVTLALIIFASSVFAGPCVLTQLDRQQFISGGSFPVYAVSASEACPTAPVLEGGQFFNPYAFALARLDVTTGEYRHMKFTFGSIPMADVRRRTLVETLSLGDGQYQLVVTNGVIYQQQVFFTVGGSGESQLFSLAPPKPRLALPYIRSAAIVKDGYLYFRGDLGHGRFAEGYFYQIREGLVEILSTIFETVDPQDQSIFVNLPQVRGGALDLPWVRAKLINNKLDPTSPVYSSITNYDGLTVSDMVYDPADPAKYFSGFQAAR